MGSATGPNHFWSWSPQWEAAVDRALAHPPTVSGGRPVRRAVLAGPELSTPDADAQASSSYRCIRKRGRRGVRPAFPGPHLPVPASGGMPGGVHRDDPPSGRPAEGADTHAGESRIPSLPPACITGFGKHLVSHTLTRPNRAV